MPCFMIELTNIFKAQINGTSQCPHSIMKTCFEMSKYIPLITQLLRFDTLNTLIALMGICRELRRYPKHSQYTILQNLSN